MHILDRFKQLEENFYLDSMSDSDTDLTEQAEPEEEQQAEQMADQQLAQGGAEGMDPGMGAEGMGGMEGEGGFGMEEEEIKTSTELGRIYELNKIYYRLYVINKFLKNTSDEKLQKVKKMVGEAFDIYRLVLNNIKSYKEEIDDIILKYYKFISHLVLALEDYYKRKYQTIAQSTEQN